MFQYTGEYIKSKTIHGSEFYTFIPAPLCKDFSIDMDAELFSLITTTHKLLGVLEGMAVYLPNTEPVQRLIRLKECCHSIQIDYKDSLAFRDTFKKISSGQEIMELILNLVAAYQFAYGKNVGHPELSKVYSIILSGSEKEQIADVRKIAIPLKNVITNLKAYSPTDPKHIMPAFYDMVKFINMDNHIDILIKIAIAHYQFEMIHPFDRYNGLVGRIMNQMILLDARYKAASYMCPSEFFYLNKEEYFDKLSATQGGSGFMPWVKFFIRGICFAADQSIVRIKRFNEVISEAEQKMAALALPSKHIFSVYNYFKQYLLSEIRPISNQLEISYNTAAKVVMLLAESDILMLEQKQSRHKMYCLRGLEAFDAIGSI